MLAFFYGLSFWNNEDVVGRRVVTAQTAENSLARKSGTRTTQQKHFLTILMFTKNVTKLLSEVDFPLKHPRRRVEEVLVPLQLYQRPRGIWSEFNFMTLKSWLLWRAFTFESVSQPGLTKSLQLKIQIRSTKMNMYCWNVDIHNRERMSCSGNTDEKQINKQKM